MRDITIVEGNNELNVELVPIAPAAWVLPTGHADPENGWDYEANAYDDDIETYAENWTGTKKWSAPIELTIAPTSISAVRFYLTSPLTPKIGDIDVYYEGAWHDVWQGDPVSGSGGFASGWNEREIPAGIKVVTKARFRMYNRSYSREMWFRLHEFEFRAVG